MKNAINLLPTGYRRQLMLRRRAIQWGVAVCVVVLMIWAGRWYKMREFHALWQQWEVLAREYRPTQAMIREIESMREQLKELDRQEMVAKELDHQRHVLTLLGIVSEAAQQSQGKLRVTDLQVVDLQRVNPSRGHQSAVPQGGSLAVTGVSLDSPIVAELLDKLQYSGLFTSVELVLLKERKEEDATLHDFQVRCQL